MAQMRSPESFKRRGARYKVQPLVLVVCEDAKSSKTYLEDASRHFRAYAQVEFVHPGKTDPLGVVSSGVKRAKGFDHVYCVIDRDSHHEPNFLEALALGEANKDKVTVLTSYPCFEFWLLLHFEYTRAPFMPAGGVSAADRVLQSLKTKPDMAAYAKGKVGGLFEKLLPLLPDARKHAPRTVMEGVADAEMNPSTPLHLLIDRLEGLGKLTAIE